MLTHDTAVCPALSNCPRPRRLGQAYSYDTPRPEYSAPATPDFHDWTSGEGATATVQDSERNAFWVILALGIVVTLVGVVTAFRGDSLATAAFVTLVGLLISAVPCGGCPLLPLRHRHHPIE
jgi:hypothetical protein